MPALPAAGGTLFDPTFGTEILRVTDSADGSNCSIAYSYWPSFNVDSTRLQATCSSGAKLFAIDPVDLVLGASEPLFASAPPGGGMPSAEDAIWSGIDPNVIYAHEGQRIWAYNVATHAWTLVKSFAGVLPPGYLWQMSRSIDDNVFAFTVEDTSWAFVGYAAWQRDTDTMLIHESSSLDEVQIDKSGNFLTVQTGLQGAGTIQVRVADLVHGTMVDLTDNGPDYAPAHGDSGVGIMVGNDNWLNRVTYRSLATPHDVQTLLSYGSDWSQAMHTSLLVDGDAHAYVSLYGSHSTGLFHNEIIAVATDGSGSVYRLAHHRSVMNSYEDAPRANVSRDGCRVAFTSNWGGSGRRDVFVL
ncbi:MAG: hypothetical protein IT373_27145, partial [Polyangiaceae bacterium]|nr:hypothetical protein [Polyangiaceae bacterium]